MSTTAVTALRVFNEAFLVSSTIDRCPKTMMLRELVMNAIEGAQGAISGERLVEIKAVTIEGARKLCIWNAALGLTADELEKMSDLAASVRKENSLDQNFGMGAKVASLPSNKSGLRYRSCRDGRVHEILLGQRDGVYGRVHDAASPRDAADVSAAAAAEGADLSRDWVEVVLFGNGAAQDTVRDPYAGNPTMPPDWILASLSRRFFRLPAGVTLRLATEITGTAEPVVFKAEGAEIPPTARAETVQATPDIAVHYYYLPVAQTGSSPLLGSGCVVHRDEIYGLVDGANWVREAVGCGIPFGAGFCTVVVELSQRFEVRAETYRQFLRFSGGDQRQVYLKDFASTIRAAMPAWLRDIVASHAPPEVDFMGEIRRDLRELIEALEIAPVRRDDPFTRGTPEQPKPERKPDDKAKPHHDLPPPAKLFERPPEIINLRDQAAIDERELNGRAASYAPQTHQLFVNMQYPAILAMKEQLERERVWEADPDLVSRNARTVAEWVATHTVARAVIYALSKRALGWSADEIARAQSPESLSVAADDFATLILPARRRLFDMMGEVWMDDTAVGDGAPAARDAVKAIKNLMQARQAARAKLGQGLAAIPFLRRVSDIELAQGNVAEAEAWIEQALEIDPGDAGSHKQHAVVLQARGALDDAVKALERGLATEPAHSAPFEEHLSHLAVRQGRLQDALRWAQTAVASDPENLWAVNHLSIMHERVGDPEEARDIVALALAQKLPNSALLMRRMSDMAMRGGDMAEAMTWAERAVAESPKDANSHLHLANLHERRGEFDAAWDAVEAALATAPPRPGLALRRASEVAMRRRDVHAALTRAEEAIDSDREAASFNQLANVYKAIGDLEGAERVIQQAFDIVRPPSADLLRQGADIAMRRGESDVAQDRIARAIALDDRNPWNHQARSYILERAGDLDGAAGAAMEAVRVAADRIHFQGRVIDLALARRLFDDARRLADEMIAAMPGDPRGYVQLSRVCQQVGDLDDAEAAIGKALDLGEPVPAHVLRRASEVARARGDGPTALRLAGQAAEASPTDPWAYHYLSMVCQDQGDMDGAKDAARRALLIGAPDPTPFQKRIDYLDWQEAQRPAA